MQVGPYQLYDLMLDHFRLDGGAMFGAVPKNLWEKRIPADSENCIALGCRSLVLKSPDRLVLIDLGCGDKWDAKQRQIYNIEPQNDPRSLPVTDIIISHLHFDHCGAITSLDAEGKPTLSFPNANVYLQERNFERAQSPGPRERATYFPVNVEPLKAAKLHLASDSEEILPEVRVFEINGHTDGMQWVLIGSGSNAVAFPADLIPTAHHLPIPYLMGYDLCATTTMNEKEAFLSEAERQGWWLVFDHDADTPIARVGRDSKGSYCVAEKGTLPKFPIQDYSRS